MCTGDTGVNMSHSGVSTKMHSGLQNATHEGIFGYFCDDVEFHIQHCWRELTGDTRMSLPWYNLASSWFTTCYALMGESIPSTRCLKKSLLVLLRGYWIPQQSLLEKAYWRHKGKNIVFGTFVINFCFAPCRQFYRLYVSFLLIQLELWFTIHYAVADEKISSTRWMTLCWFRTDQRILMLFKVRAVVHQYYDIE